VPRLEAYVQDTTRTYTGLPAFNGNWGGTSSWYAREDSNLWPLAPEASALSAELRAQVFWISLYPISETYIPTTGECVRSRVGVASVCAKRLLLAGYRDFNRRTLLLPGGSMSFRDRVSEPGRVRLNEEDVAYVMNLLRNATQPVNTQQLIDVLRKHPGQFQTASQAATDATADSQG
jgi:hypothetical protein